MTGGFVYSEKPIRIESGDGVHLYDESGNEYLDFGASYGVAAVGHCHPEVVSAVQEQVEKLTFVQASYPNSARDGLYDKLAAVAPGDLENVWLCNSGTEANEAAIKFARSATGDSKIVAAQRGFHGRTMGSLAATWKPKYKTPFEPLAGDFEFVPYGDEEALAEAVDEETAAVLLEPIQGEGGVNPAPEGYLQAAREVTEETGSALILDEIQTGLGRTGALWACEKRGVVPDVLTSAKGLGGGLPVGATLCADWIAENAGPHGSTFSGGPVVSAAAEATLSVVAEEDLAANAAEVGNHLQSKLGGSELPIRTVRGEGLLLGAEVKRGANRLLKHLAMDHGILALPAGRTVVRLLPPLTVDESHADEVVAALESVLAEVSP
ncbi:aspartate aminotransferase family protein [Halorussus sp. MSC15.2]|uniref:aspartate aminotransferase family protein n=1 Tax=Halorussus sp. MSC15.2 TaxID=2283638 RepID=UPI0013D597C0|nr:aspartate aminotransferase family protein [Halorussus sp. MSC15.2]NEU55267.1 aspartate aminotransferase family protein [Halorussus sp. MSC15.2]